MKNTALMELIEWLRTETWGFEQPCESGRPEIDPIKIYNKATELLSKEREDIKDAFNQGYREGESSGMNFPDSADTRDVAECANAMIYFYDTFNQLP